MHRLPAPELLTTLVHAALVVGLGLRIIAKRRPTGVGLAWITLVAVLPLLGAMLYLMVGELWLAGGRVRRAKQIGPAFRRRMAELVQQAPAELENLSTLSRTLDAYATRGAQMPTLGGNDVTIYNTAESAFGSLIDDINAAEHRVYLLFYIWSPGGLADAVGEAVIRAARRGVDCRVLLDSYGSNTFFRSPWPRRFAEAGVRTAEALKVNRLRLFMHRLDLRNHRKLAAIDGKVGYCGSQNIADPAFFKANAGVGPWIDLMCRVDGPGGEAIELTFQHDWCIEADRKDPTVFVDIHPEPYSAGSTRVQLINSGPAQSPRAIEDMLLTMVFGCRENLTLTTPYFIPTEAMERALQAAAIRGVDVRVVVPRRNDSRLVALASRSYYGDLLETGVQIWEYEDGLLHAKTATADGHVAMVGSANMDRRSFAINYESGLFIYDEAFTGELRRLQNDYIRRSIKIERRDWSGRPMARRIVENAMQLFAPIL